jgi:hypothetical protein
MPIHLYPHVQCPLSHNDFQTDLNEIKLMTPINQTKIINLHTHKYLVLMCENSELFPAYVAADHRDRQIRARMTLKHFLYEYSENNTYKDPLKTTTLDTNRENRLKKSKSATKTLRKEAK